MTQLPGATVSAQAETVSTPQGREIRESSQNSPFASLVQSPVTGYSDRMCQCAPLAVMRKPRIIATTSPFFITYLG
jgi:hypothetical protein